jgi:hypothetical protein
MKAIYFFCTHFLFFVLFFSPLFAQKIDSIPSKNESKFYFFWGYNREYYSNSTIHFKNTVSDNYDFTFIDAKAEDKPDFQNALNIGQISVPQFNMHLGYLFGGKRNFGIEFSWDHLKYVVKDNQILHVQGQIRGNKIDKDTLVTPDFVHLQHTNGNNYMMLSFIKKINIYKHKNLEISTLAKWGAGILMSYSISTILGSPDNGHFRYHGLVTGGGFDLRMDLYRYVFLQAGIQVAYADYTSIQLGQDLIGRAEHDFFSYQAMLGIGFNIPTSKR